MDLTVGLLYHFQSNVLCFLEKMVLRDLVVISPEPGLKKYTEWHEFKHCRKCAKHRGILKHDVFFALYTCLLYCTVLLWTEFCK